jgi:hypothetical protein
LNNIHAADDIGVFQAHKSVLLGHEQVSFSLVINFFHIDDFNGNLLAGTRVNA